jgi:hypothetical protein
MKLIEQRRPGRPGTGRALKVNVSVMLDPHVDEQLRDYGDGQLRDYGDGNLSAGVARVAEVARAKHLAAGA